MPRCAPRKPAGGQAAVVGRGSPGGAGNSGTWDSVRSRPLVRPQNRFLLRSAAKSADRCANDWVREKAVLNLFAYTGGFGLVAAAHGAARVMHVDSSIPALEMAEANTARNGWQRPQDEYIAADVFELLRYYRDEGDARFDLIILDPPKFAHSRRDVQRASRGYKDLNWLAMRLLNPGGLGYIFLFRGNRCGTAAKDPFCGGCRCGASGADLCSR
jgi:hypothetical protein